MANCSCHPLSLLSFLNLKNLNLKNDRPTQKAIHSPKNRSLFLSLLLLLLFSAIEIGAAILSHSLFLFADFAHVLSDVAALGMTAFVQWLTQTCQRQSAKLQAHAHSHQDLNFKGAFLHAVADLLTSLGTIATAITVIWLHWNWTDSAMSLLIAVLILSLALSLLSQSIDQLRHPWRDEGQGDRSIQAFTAHALICPADCRCLVESEKLLFPSLQELIR